MEAEMDDSKSYEMLPAIYAWLAKVTPGIIFRIPG
jgi:hypothetical protein